VKFSPDGRHLAIGLMGAQGLRIFRVRDRALVASDRDYRDKLLELDFNPNGRLVATGLDGFVRAYDHLFKLSGRVDAGLAGREPFGIRHSRDGQFIAVGFNDVARVSVLRASDLSVVATLTGSVSRNLTRVAWSPDGAVVFAAGESRDGSVSSLFRWRMADPSRAEPLPEAPGRIGDLAVTRDNLLLFGAEDPTLGAIDPAGRIRYALRTGIPDYRALGGKLRTSPDGSIVELPVGSAGLRRRRRPDAQWPPVPARAFRADPRACVLAG
jgi:WD40 repeat protein